MSKTHSLRNWFIKAIKDVHSSSQDNLKIHNDFTVHSNSGMSMSSLKLVIQQHGLTLHKFTTLICKIKELSSQQALLQ
jgi:hypothetical protein